MEGDDLNKRVLKSGKVINTGRMDPNIGLEDEHSETSGQTGFRDSLESIRDLQGFGEDGRIQERVEDITDQSHITQVMIHQENEDKDMNTGRSPGPIDTMTMLSKLFERMERKMEENTEKLSSSLDKKMEGMERQMEENTNELKGEIKKVKEELEKQFEGKFGNMEKKVEKLTNENTFIKQKMEEENKKVQQINEEVIIIKDKLDNLEGEYKTEIEIVAGTIFENKEKEIKQVCGERMRKTEERIMKKIEEERQESQNDKINGRELIIENHRDHEEKLNKLGEKMEKKINRLREIYEENVNNGGVRNVIMGGTIDSNLKFIGYNNNIHPKIFLKSLKYKVKNINNIEALKEVIRGMMSGEAYVWFTSNEERMKNIEDFEKCFIEKYWGEIQQERFREKLYFGKYGGGDKNLFVMKLYNDAQFLEPEMKEEEIVKYISRQFEDRIRETIIFNDIKNMEQLSRYLIRLENVRGDREGMVERRQRIREYDRNRYDEQSSIQRDSYYREYRNPRNQERNWNRGNQSNGRGGGDYNYRRPENQINRSYGGNYRYERSENPINRRYGRNFNRENNFHQPQERREDEYQERNRVFQNRNDRNLRDERVGTDNQRNDNRPMNWRQDERRINVVQNRAENQTEERSNEEASQNF